MSDAFSGEKPDAFVEVFGISSSKVDRQKLGNVLTLADLITLTAAFSIHSRNMEAAVARLARGDAKGCVQALENARVSDNEFVDWVRSIITSENG